MAAPITLVYGDHDWSRPSDRDANEHLLPHARRVDIAAAGHFIALEQPRLLAEILRDHHR